MIRHTTHSLEQCKERGFDPQAVMKGVRKYQGRIYASNAGEVIVVLKVFKQRIYIPNPGKQPDSGDCVAAFVDPYNKTIKTVSLQRWEQIERKAARSEWVNEREVEYAKRHLQLAALDEFKGSNRRNYEYHTEVQPEP